MGCRVNITYFVSCSPNCYTYNETVNVFFVSSHEKIRLSEKLNSIFPSGAYVKCTIYFYYYKVTGKFSIRLVPKQDPAHIGQLVIAHLEKVHLQRGSPNVLT